MTVPSTFKQKPQGSKGKLDNSLDSKSLFEIVPWTLKCYIIPSSRGTLILLGLSYKRKIQKQRASARVSAKLNVPDLVHFLDVCSELSDSLRFIEKSASPARESGTTSFSWTLHS